MWVRGGFYRGMRVQMQNNSDVSSNADKLKSRKCSKGLIRDRETTEAQTVTSFFIEIRD